MPKINFTDKEVNFYATGEYKHQYKKCSEEDAEEIRIHADGCEPYELLCKQRPNEPIEVKDYRMCIWEPITQQPISKVISSLQKIRRSPDYVIKYNEQDEFKLIRDGFKLDNYCEEHFPYFRSVTNWVFSLYLRKYLIDANSVVFIRPMDMLDAAGYYQPIPEIFDSCHVIEIVEDDYAVLKNPLGCYYYDEVNGEQKQIKGESFYVITTQSIWRYDQVSGKSQFQLAQAFDHELGILPAFKVPAQIKEMIDGRIYNASRIQPMICHLNEAAREYSDLQAAKVLHMHPERWEFTQAECTSCKGTGKRPNPLWTGPECNCEQQITCNECGGRMYKVAGPYAKIMVRPTNAIEGGGQIPTPPAGYIEKDVEIIKVQEASVDAHLMKALASVNMEFMNQVPLTNSGIAKEVDRDESRNTIHSVAEDVVSAMDRIYFIIAKYRYGNLYTDEDLMKMIPQIPVPEKYDLVTSAQALTELKLAKDGRTNPVIVNAMERDFASKRFSTDPEIQDQLVLELELDPLPNITEDDKNSRLQNKGITQETYVISSNIHEFVSTAIAEDETFPAWDPIKQKEKLLEYAQALIEETSTASAIIGPDEPQVIDPVTGLPVQSNNPDQPVPGGQPTNPQPQQQAA